MSFASDFERLVGPFLMAGILTEGDVFPVTLAAPRFGESNPETLLGLAFVVRAPRVGHPAVDLSRVASLVADERRLHASEEESLAPLPWPEPSSWLAAVLRSGMVGEPGDTSRPFVRQRLRAEMEAPHTVLLTRRMFREQERVAAAMVARASRPLGDSYRVRELDARLAELFGDEAHGEAAKAVRVAAENSLAVIIGGPGTGKTYSVSRLLGALFAPRPRQSEGLADASRNVEHLKVLLAAPTGKAAARMREAMREATSAEAHPVLAVEESVRVLLQNLPAETVHRLVGVRPDGTCRHHAGNPIPADVVVVDEVSMVDLANMRRLLEAVAPSARLVLLGDRDQLASVEAGCVLADLVDGASTGPLAERICSFTVSRRFAAAPDIGLVAACLQSYETAHAEVPKGTDAEGLRLRLAVEVMMGRTHASNETATRIVALGPPEASPRGLTRPARAQLETLARPYLEGYAAMLAAHRRTGGTWAASLEEPSTQRAILQAFERYRVLAVHRRGPLGVAGLERALADSVRRTLHGDGVEGRYWVGRPILVTENAYDVKLMNGDVGLVLPTREGLAAVFPAEEAAGVRAVATSRLPPHEGALAMTVHKSQGSQFESVALVLAGRASPIQTRELIYTGVTRAKAKLTWLGEESELAEALERKSARGSGLAELLRGRTGSHL